MRGSGDLVGEDAAKRGWCGLAVGHRPRLGDAVDEKDCGSGSAWRPVKTLTRMG